MRSSKYDAFWESIIDVLADLIEEAFARGRSRSVDVSGLRSYGERSSWYGSVIVSRGGVIRAEMAHARSLGKVLLREGVLDRFGDAVFVLKISSGLRLHAELLRKGERGEGRHTSRRESLAGGRVNEFVDESVYLRVHQLLEPLPKHRYPLRLSELPRDGIYFFYEEGEVIERGGLIMERVVRVGTHREDGRLPHRLGEHFRGNKASSVFRRHLGDALIAKYGLGAALDEDVIEHLISEALRNRFSFRVLRVGDAAERLELEERLIATIARFSPRYVSPDWLGRYSPNLRIRGSGLWNVDHVDSPRLMGEEHVRRLEELVYRTLQSEVGNALILIPCSKTKEVRPASGGFEEPMPGVEALRAKLIEAIKATPGLRDRPENVGGVLAEDAPLVRAIDLYAGRLHARAREALAEIRSGRYPFIQALIVSALYGLARLGEGLRPYDLTMTDELADGSRVHQFWERAGLWRVLLNHIIINKVRAVWSLLPSSDQFPYHQVFSPLWELLRDAGIRCYHVETPDAGTASGIRRAEWLTHIMKESPATLLKGPRADREEVSGHEVRYVPCHEVG